MNLREFQRLDTAREAADNAAAAACRAQRMEPSSPIRIRPAWRTTVGLVLVAALAVAAYANSLAGGFVWDDRILILEGRLPRATERLAEIFTHDFFHRSEIDNAYGYYRPLATLSYVWDYAWWRLDPFGYHLTNVVLHAVNSALACLVLLRLGLALRTSVLAGMLFAVHPIHTESVAWIAGRTDLLAFAFSLISLLLYDDRRGRWLAPATLFAALLAKEMAVVTVAWAALVEILLRGRDLRGAGRATAPLVATVAAYAVWRFVVVDVGGPGSPPEHTAMAVVLTLPSVVLRYLAWMTWPLSHSAYVIHPYVDTVASPRFWLAAVGLGAIATAAWRATRSSPQARRLQLLATMVVAGLSPLVGLWRPAGPADMGAMTAERFAYFPSFPFLALVACGLAYGLRSRAEPRRWAARVTVAVVLVAGTTATAARNRDWRDEKTFLDATLREAPTSTLLWGRLVQHHLERRDTDAAAAAIERARAAGAGGSALWSTEAHLLQQQGRIAEAIPLQERFVRSAHQARVPALNNLAYLYRLDGRTADAKEILEGLVADGSAYADVYANLAAVYRGEGDLDRARQAYRAALRDRPDHLRTAGALVSLEVEAGRPEAAARVYEEMLRYHPGNRRLRNNLGLLRAESGDDDGAAALFGALVATYPDYANARVNYAQVLFRLDRSAEAQAQLRAARPLVRGTELEAIVERQLDGATSQRE